MNRSTTVAVATYGLLLSACSNCAKNQEADERATDVRLASFGGVEFLQVEHHPQGSNYELYVAVTEVDRSTLFRFIPDVQSLQRRMMDRGCVHEGTLRNADPEHPASCLSFIDVVDFIGAFAKGNDLVPLVVASGDGLLTVREADPSRAGVRVLTVPEYEALFARDTAKCEVHNLLDAAYAKAVSLQDPPAFTRSCDDRFAGPWHVGRDPRIARTDELFDVKGNVKEWSVSLGGDGRPVGYHAVGGGYATDPLSNSPWDDVVPRTTAAADLGFRLAIVVPARTPR